MHDATEGGVRNAVWEMAQASGLGVEVDLTKVFVDPAVLQVSKLFGITPHDRMAQFASISFDIAIEEIFPTWISGGTRRISSG